MLIENFIHLFLESAPWLLLGLVLAGLLKVFVPMEWMQKQLGGHGFKTVLKAAILGAPLPLCSCGVIPAAVGLRRSGASKAATTSFLVSTPETGVDSVTVSYVLLGPFMAIVRPIAAITSAVVAGLLVGRDDDDGKPNDKANQAAEEKPAAALAEANKSSSCCASQPAKNKAITTNNYFYPSGSSTPNIVTTNETFSYNTLNKQIASHTVNNSVGETLTTNYFYHTGNSPTSQNRISEIERIETKKGTELLSESKINYNNTFAGNQSFLPSTIEVKKGQIPSEVRLKNNRFDEFGHVLEVEQDSGVKICYIYGYNKTQQ